MVFVVVYIHATQRLTKPRTGTSERHTNGHTTTPSKQSSAITITYTWYDSSGDGHPRCGMFTKLGKSRPQLPQNAHVPPFPSDHPFPIHRQPSTRHSHPGFTPTTPTCRSPTDARVPRSHLPVVGPWTADGPQLRSLRRRPMSMTVGEPQQSGIHHRRCRYSTS